MVTELRSALEVAVQVYLFLARPALLLVPAVGLVAILLAGTWPHFVPPRKAARRLALEHIAVGGPFALGVVHLVLWSYGLDISQVLRLVWTDAFVLYVLAASVLGFATHVLLFRVGDLDAHEPPFRVSYAIADGAIEASVCVAAVGMRIGGYWLSAAAVTASACCFAWYIYQYPTTCRLARAAGGLGVDIRDWRLAWTSLLVMAGLAMAMSLFIACGSPFLTGLSISAPVALRSSLFGVWAGASAVSLVSILISGVIVLSSVAMKLVVAGVAGGFWGLTVFATIVVPFVARVDDALLTAFQMVLLVSLAVVGYLLIGQLVAWPLRLGRGRLVILRLAPAPAVRRPSELVARGDGSETRGLNPDSAERLLRLADFIVWTVLLAGEAPYAQVKTELIRGCARSYLSDLEQATFDELYERAVRDLLLPEWMDETCGEYALRDFAYRFLWAPADDPQAMQIARQCLAEAGHSAASVDPRSVDRAGYLRTRAAA